MIDTMETDKRNSNTRRLVNFNDGEGHLFSLFQTVGMALEVVVEYLEEFVFWQAQREGVMIGESSEVVFVCVSCRVRFRHSLLIILCDTFCSLFDFITIRLDFVFRIVHL